MEISTKAGGIKMTSDSHVLATTAKVIVTSLMVMAILNVLHWLDPNGNILTLLGFWAIMVMCWKSLDYEGKPERE
jgi:hypothetical protein